MHCPAGQGQLSATLEGVRLGLRLDGLFTWAFCHPEPRDPWFESWRRGLGACSCLLVFALEARPSADAHLPSRTTRAKRKACLHRDQGMANTPLNVLSAAAALDRTFALSEALGQSNFSPGKWPAPALKPAS